MTDQLEKLVLLTQENAAIKERLEKYEGNSHGDDKPDYAMMSNKMTDLTKLTADELRVRFDVLRPKMNVPARLVLAEISRRLERLEKCEAALK